MFNFIIQKLNKWFGEANLFNSPLDDKGIPLVYLGDPYPADPEASTAIAPLVINESGPEAACPQPADGLSFNERGVLSPVKSQPPKKAHTVFTPTAVRHKVK